MKIIGRRREAPLSFSASGELLAQGARFNDDLRGLPTGDAAFSSSWKRLSKSCGRALLAPTDFYRLFATRVIDTGSYAC